VIKTSGLRIAKASSLPLGREDSFTALYRDHHAAVRSILFRFKVRDLEDLLQEVFLKAYRKQDMFRAEASPRSWLIRIAINVAKDHLKHSHTKRETALLEPEQVAGSEAKGPLADIIEACMDQLHVQHREILILCVIEGYSMKEAATILEIPEGTIKSRLSSARQDMMKRLKAEGVEA